MLKVIRVLVSWLFRPNIQNVPVAFLSLFNLLPLRKAGRVLYLYSRTSVCTCNSFLPGCSLYFWICFFFSFFLFFPQLKKKRQKKISEHNLEIRVPRALFWRTDWYFLLCCIALPINVLHSGFTLPLVKKKKKKRFVLSGPALHVASKLMKTHPFLVPGTYILMEKYLWIANR